MPVPDKDVVSASFTTFDGLTVDLRLMERDKADWVDFGLFAWNVAGYEVLEQWWDGLVHAMENGGRLTL